MHATTASSFQGLDARRVRSLAGHDARLAAGAHHRKLHGGAAAPAATALSGSVRLPRRAALRMVCLAQSGRFSPPWSATGGKQDGGKGQSPWMQLLQGLDGQPGAAKPPPLPKREQPLPDPATGLIDWSPAVVTSLDSFWSRERGVTELVQRRRHVAHAELDPKQRDLEYVRARMASWDSIINEVPGVDPNRVVRNGIDIMEKPPEVWMARVILLAAAYPDVNWSQIFAEYPSLCYMPHPELVRAVNDWADSLTGGGPCGGLWNL